MRVTLKNMGNKVRDQNIGSDFRVSKLDGVGPVDNRPSTD